MRHRIVRVLPWGFAALSLVVAGVLAQSSDRRDERAARREALSVARERRLIDELTSLRRDVGGLRELVGELGAKLDIANAEITRLGGQPVPSGIPVAPTPVPESTAPTPAPATATTSAPPQPSPSSGRSPPVTPRSTRPCVIGVLDRCVL